MIFPKDLLITQTNRVTQISYVILLLSFSLNRAIEDLSTMFKDEGNEGLAITKEHIIAYANIGICSDITSEDFATYNLGCDYVTQYLSNFRAGVEGNSPTSRSDLKAVATAVYNILVYVNASLNRNIDHKVLAEIISPFILHMLSKNNGYKLTKIKKLKKSKTLSAIDCIRWSKTY